MKWTQHITAQASDEASKSGSQQLFADSISFHLQNDTIEHLKHQKESKTLQWQSATKCNRAIFRDAHRQHTHTHKQNLKPISNSSEEMNYSYKNFGRNAFAKSTWGPLPASNAAASATISDRPVFFVCSDWLV